MVDSLFVYGTLRGEFDNPHARMLRQQAHLIGPATAPGSIFRIAHYPGYRPDPPGEVHGELYRLTNPAVMLATLDEYEAPEFTRVLTKVSGDRIAWIYQVELQPPLDARIASGDFCAP